MDPGECDDVTIYLPSTDPDDRLEVRLSADTGLAFNEACTNRRHIWSAGLAGRGWYSQEFLVYACHTSTGSGTLTAKVYRGSELLGMDSDTAIITSPSPTPTPTSLPLLPTIPNPDCLYVETSVEPATGTSSTSEDFSVWLFDKVKLGTCVNASIYVDSTKERSYEAQLIVNQHLAFDPECTLRNAHVKGSASTFYPDAVVFYTCSVGIGELTVDSLKINGVSYPPGNWTGSRRMRVIPRPTPDLPILPEQHPSKKCIVVSGSGNSDYIEGELNGIRYNAKSAVAVGLGFWDIASSTLPSREAPTHCLYFITSHSASSKESSVTVDFVLETGRFDQPSGPIGITRESCYKECYKLESICVLAGPLWGVSLKAWYHIITVTSDHKFTTTEEPKPLLTRVCYSTGSSNSCMDGDTND